jgi:hypothetical protein
MDNLTLEFHFVTYDDIFEKTQLSPIECATALFKLGKSGVSSIVRRERGFISDVSEKLKWTAGYVVAWVEDKEFQRRSRERMYEAIREYEPDIILAHSLGSLVTYNAFSDTKSKEGDLKRILAKATYVTFGSQIGNPFVLKNLTNGRVQPLPVRFWNHIYNEHDDVFTAEIKLSDAKNFSQTLSPFDDEGTGDHAAESYFRHKSTIENVWRPLASKAVGERNFAPPTSLKARTAAGAPRNTRKALLIGINEYPDPSNRLEGCVNDVFTMSSVLQECGFPPESIRTCLDHRATAAGIIERLKWLLDDPQPGDELVFYYSGHGAQVPEYGDNFEPDHFVETLVPWDFDWTPEKYIADHQIYGLYSQLPYDTRLIMIFDCCHSGSMHRNGAEKPRGITPPDDIRHRELKWDSKTQMWVSRDFARINPKFTTKKAVAESFFGEQGATERLGRASMLRGLSASEYDRLIKAGETETARGPYLPLIIEACGEGEKSYEYRHGAISHGAFTYSLANILRREKTVTFEGLVEQTRLQLADLQYNQHPQILGPTSIMKQKVPWVSGSVPPTQPVP